MVRYLIFIHVFNFIHVINSSKKTEAGTNFKNIKHLQKYTQLITLHIAFC